jgi:outer membrane receptor protein involved in Fe transport
MVAPDAAFAAVQQAGSIRGVVLDRDFDAPLPAAQVLVVESGQKTATTDQGTFVLGQVAPGKYTLVFSKEGYVREVRADVVVTEGRLTELSVSLAGDITEMEEFVVQDILEVGAGSEIELLNLRFESPALMDSVSADVMNRAGASDAAGALRLVAGATVQDGKSAVIRGLPDRYVSSQMNGVRLPSADEDKRAVELDQFPTAAIESIRVTKSFTPDQQGDASGGAVDVRLKGIPSEALFQVKGQLGRNSQVRDRSDFLTYDGGGVTFWGRDDGDRDMQLESLGGNWDGAAGVSEGDAPIESKWSLAFGGSRDVGAGLRIGAFASFFHEHDASFFDDGFDDSYWVDNPGEPLTPETVQGTPSDGDFKTALFDLTQGTESVQWGGLAAVGLESEHHALTLAFLHTRTAEDTATLAVDTRGKEYFFPGYDPNDPTGPGNTPSELNSAPWLRLETLEYTERTTGTLQLTGRHRLPIGDSGPADGFGLRDPELDWVLARSSADLNQPDKRQFGALWLPPSFHPGAPPFLPPFTTPPTWFPYKPGANFTLGNFQRIWKEIEEESDQYAVNLRLPFTQWSGDEGYFKLGLFRDQVDRRFDQDTFSNFNDNSSFIGEFDDPWSGHFPSEDHPITASSFDVDYDGDLEVSAWYGMLDLPLFPKLNVIGGARFESTEISIDNEPEKDATWFPPGATAPVKLNPGDADVDFEDDHVLPSIGLIYQPFDGVAVRGGWSRTIARQTFKELTPILQQEFLGGPVFVGNPDLKMSELENYDVRCDWAPYEGGLLSASWFHKRIDDPIEYVQRLAGFTFTTARNYPEGELTGWEFEVRQDLGRFWSPLQGLAIGGNATFIDSEVQLPKDEIAEFNLPNIRAPMTSRDMTNAPEHLYNLYLTYDLVPTGTQLAVYYTVQGDTLIAGAGQSNGNFVPSLYATEFDTLNLSVSQKLGWNLALQLQVKNLTNAKLETEYRSEHIPASVTHSSHRTGIDYSIALSWRVRL